MPRPPRRSLYLVLAVLGLLTVILALEVVTPEIPLDDPFIALRYVRNWMAGDGLVYNAGEPAVEGYTAFLWIAMVAPAMMAGYEPLPAWQTMAVLLQVATLWLLFALGRPRSDPAARALLAPALLAVHVSFVYYPMTGMETTFLTFLVTLAVLFVSRGWHHGTRGALLLGLLLAILCLARFDAFGLAGLLLAWILIFERRLRTVLWAAVPLAALLTAYNLWRLSYYGALLPNTFYAKTSEPLEQIWAGLVYVGEFAAKGGPFWLLVAVPLFARLGRKRFPVEREMHPATRVCLWVVLGQIGYVVVVGGDWMPYYRFVLPVLPLLCLLLQEAFWWGIDRLSAGGLGRAAVRGLAWAGVALLLSVGAMPLAASRFVRPPPPGAYWSTTEARTIGLELDRNLPADASVAVEWAGIIPYYLDRPVLDIFGLSETEITRGEFPGSRMGRAITPEYLVERAPDVVVYTARLYPSAEAAAAAGPEIRGEGLWITGFYSSLLEPRYGYAMCVMQFGPERYWPALVRADWEARQELCLPAAQ